MSHRIILSPGARADIRSAVAWYRRLDIDVPFRFIAETQAILRRIAQNPKAFPIVRNVTRRALMNKFPYIVYFRLHANSVVVRAILHQRRSHTISMTRRNGRK